MWYGPGSSRAVEGFRPSRAGPGAGLMNWNDERVELLRKLWAEGQSASQIAAQLGGVSRNAVIGKVHRLKLSSRGRANAAPARQKKTSHGSAVTKAVTRAAATARVDAGFHRRDRLANSVRGSAGHPPLYTPRRAGRGTHLAPAPTGSAQRTHVQVAQWRPAVGRFQFLRQRHFRKAPIAPITRGSRFSRRPSGGATGKHSPTSLGG